MRFFGLNPAVLLPSAITLLATSLGHAQNQQMPRDYGGVQIVVPGIYVTPIPNSPSPQPLRYSLTNSSPTAPSTPTPPQHTWPVPLPAASTTSVASSYRRTPWRTGASVRSHLRSLQPPQYLLQPFSAHRSRKHTAPASRSSCEFRSFLARLPAIPTSGRKISAPTARRPHPYRHSQISHHTGCPQRYSPRPRHRRRVLVLPRSLRLHDHQTQRPATGEQIVAVTDVDRHEPRAEIFTIPASYKIVDENPPEQRAQ